MKKTLYHSLDLALNQLLRPLFENLSSDPAATKSRFYYNTASNRVRYHNGTEWVFFIDSLDPRLTDKRDPKVHVLADSTGLGPDHVISGAAVGAVLRAISGSNARFERLLHSDLMEIGVNTHNQIDSHIADAARHFLINDSGNASTEVFSANKVLQLISSVAQAATGALVFMGGYDPVTSTPNIVGGLTVKKGHTYVITTAGNFYATPVVPGDMVIAQQDGADTLPKWLVISKNIPPIADASTTEKGIIAIATDAEVTAGTNTTKAVTPKQVKSLAVGLSDNLVRVFKTTLPTIGATSFLQDIKALLATHVNANPITVDENTIQLFEITLGTAAAGGDVVVREVYSLSERGKGILSNLVAGSFFLVSRDTADDLANIFAPKTHTHASADVAPDPRKVDKVTSIGEERVYVVNTDGSQGVKKLSDISPNSKLDKDFSMLPSATTPLSGNETVAINQNGQAKNIPLSEIKSTTNFITAEFIYTTGPQEFIPTYTIAQILAVFVGGQKIIDFTYTPTKVTIGATSAIVPGTPVSIIYAEHLVGANLFYTKAEANELIRKPKIEAYYRFEGNVVKDLTFEARGARFLSASYSLKRVAIVFDEQSVDANKAIPIIVSLLSTNSGAPTASVAYTANCNAATGLIYNKTYVFTTDIPLAPNTLLSVGTGSFIEGAQVLRGCWVTLILEEV